MKINYYLILEYRMPKKSKKPKKDKKTKKKSTKSKSVKVIPAKAGARTRGVQQTIVVAPSGARGTYKKRRSPAEIAQEREREARKILGIPEGQKINLTGREPMGQRRPTTTRIQQPVGGFTGLTEGYGITPNNEQRMDKRLREMEVRLLNQLQQQTNTQAVNQTQNIPRTTITTQTPTQDPRLNLLRTRRQQPETELESTSTFEEDEDERNKRERLKRRERFQNEALVGELLGNIIKESVDKAEDKRRTLLQSRRRGRRVFEAEQQRQQERIDFERRKKLEKEAIKIQKAVRERQEKQRKEIEKQARQERQRAEKEDEVRPPTTFKQRLLPSQVQVPQVLQDADELINIGQTTITPQPPQPTTEERLQDIQDTQGEIETLTQQLAEELDDEEFVDVQEVETDETDFEEIDFDEVPPLPPRDPERPLPPQPHKPLPPLNQSTQTSNPTSSREIQTSVDPQLFVEVNRLRDLSQQQENKRRPLPLTPPEQLTQRARDRPPIPPIPLPDVPEPKQFQKSDASEVVSSAIDRAFDTATRRVTEAEKKRREDRRKERIRIETEQEGRRRERGEQRLLRDRIKRQQLRQNVEDVEDIVGQILSRSIVQSEASGTGQRRRGQGRKAITTEELRRSYISKANKEPPKEYLKANDRKFELQQILLGLVNKLYDDFGVNDNYIKFNARSLARITNTANDRTLRRQLFTLLDNDRRGEVIDVAREIIEIVDRIIETKRLIKEQNNILQKFRPR